MQQCKVDCKHDPVYLLPFHIRVPADLSFLPIQLGSKLGSKKYIKITISAKTASKARNLVFLRDAFVVLLGRFDPFNNHVDRSTPNLTFLLFTQG